MANEHELSERELEILRLVATGASNKEIAAKLFISPNTVKVHLSNIFGKIDVVSRTEATLYAIRHGLVSGQDYRAESAEPLPTPEPGATLPPVEEENRPALPAPPRRIWRWWIGAGVLGLLIAAIWLGSRWLGPAPQPTPAPLQQSGWLAALALPAPRSRAATAVYENAVYLIGGRTVAGVSADTLRYDSQNATWQPMAPKPVAVEEMQAAVIGEKIYIPGGVVANGIPSAVLEVYDPREDSWESRAPLPLPISGYALAAHEGRLYLFGGWDGREILDRVFVYDPLTDAWQERTPLSQARQYAAAVSFGGKILLAGGLGPDGALDRVEAYFPERELSGEAAWEERRSLPQARYAFGLAPLTGQIYLVGGLNEQGEVQTVPFKYLSQNNVWIESDPPPQSPGAFLAAVAVVEENLLHLLGGEEQSAQPFALHQVYQGVYTVVIPIIQDSSP